MDIRLMMIASLLKKSGLFVVLSEKTLDLGLFSAPIYYRGTFLKARKKTTPEKT